MRYTVVNGTEWTYPGVRAYQTGGERAALQSAKNSYATCQILLFGVAPGQEVSARLTGLPAGLEAEWYELVPIYVEANDPDVGEAGRSAYIPSKEAPFYLYDCAKPLENALTPMDGTAGLYLAVKIGKESAHGLFKGEIRLSLGEKTLEIPLSLKIYSAAVPEDEHIKIINGYRSAAAVHKLEPGSPEALEMDGKYLQMLRRMRQNMLYVGGVASKKLENGRYEFDFSGLLRNIKFYMSHGFKYFNLSSVGGRRSWKESTIIVAGMPAMSYEAYVYLSDYLPALQNFLEEQGWTERCTMGVADEPNKENATEFRALCGLVHRLAPKIKLLDAVSYGPIHGALDVWVPLNAEYDKHMAEFESFRENGGELWHYVCCGPRGEGYINRFMDYPLLSTRYLFWGNYKYNLGGYLHWAANVYQPGQDPFVQNCPTHRNADSVCTLPPGDSHIIYPGTDGPWMSLRLEAQRQSAEDFELLRAISQKDRALADSLCGEGFRSFKDVEYDPVKFEALREKILKAASEL